LTVCLVLGGAGCVWDDVEAALGLGEFHGVVACNDAGAAWPGRLDAWVSLHGEKMGLWSARRARAGYEPCTRLVGHLEARPGRKGPFVTEATEFRFPGQSSTGSSGLFALKVALVDLGFDKAVLCGVPMTAATGHFFDPADWRGASSHWRGWIEALPHINDRTRSMSGRTADLLGRPDEEWLAA